MPQSSAHSLERLDELLSWLDDNPAHAADVYLDIRFALIKIFTWNHCSDPEGLTDKVFDRVAAKLPGLKDSYEGERKLYFYAVSNNLIKEYRKSAILHVSLDDVDAPTDASLAVEGETREMRGDCLDQCLQVLTPEKRDMILDYYSLEKRDKIIHRAEMARSLGVSTRALRVRMLRIRAALEECIERCLDQKTKAHETYCP